MTNAWLRWFWLWDVFFAVVYAAVVAILLTTGAESVFRTVGAIAALTAVIPLYVWLGRPAMLADRENSWQQWLMLGGALALFVTAALVNPSASFALFAVIPMVFMSLRLFPAVVVVATAMFVPALSVLVTQGPVDVIITSLVPQAIMGIAFATLIGVWINRVITQSEQRGELLRRLEATQAEVTRLSHEAGVTAERERLAGEIHDTLAQGFTSIVTLVQAAESELGSDEQQARKHLALALRTARENLAESRALVAALAPTELTESSVVDAIRRQADRIGEETGVAAAFEVHGDRRPLPTGVDVVLLRTVQESLSNVRKHAAAEAVEVVLSYQDSAVVLLVTDDGRGFDPDRVTEGFGLRGMRSRVEQVGGRLTVTSAPGSGTTVELEVTA